MPDRLTNAPNPTRAMTSHEPDDRELQVLYFIARSVIPELDDSALGLDGEVLGVIFYGGLANVIVDAVARNESLVTTLPTIHAIVEYAAVAVQNDWERWAPRLGEFFEALDESPQANAAFSRCASDRVRAGAERVGWDWAPDD